MIYEPLLELNEQKDYVRMAFLENSSLQCFRTAALSIVTPDKPRYKYHDSF